MKKWIFWSFERGSFQYDVLCALILIVVFAIPPTVFDDRPGYMRIPDSGVRRVEDDDGNAVYTVRVNRTAGNTDTEAMAREALARYLQVEEALDVFRVEAIRNPRGVTAAYAFWLR